MIIFSLFIILVSYKLFKHASGSMSLARLNMISISFYLYLILMNYLGLILAMNGVENYALRKASIGSLKTAYIVSSYNLVALPLGMLFFKWKWRFNTRRRLQSFYTSKIRPVQSFNDSFIISFFLILTILSTLACIYSYSRINYSPLRMILGGGSSFEIAQLRYNAKFDFNGIGYIKNLFFKNLAPFLSLVSLGYKNLYPKKFLIKFWHTWNIMLAFLAVTFTGEKAPLIIYILMYFIAYSSIRGGVNKKQLFIVSIIGLSMLIYLYLLIDKKVSFTFYGGILSRIFMVPNSGLLQTLELFPDQINFLYGASFPTWMLFFFGIEQQRSARVIMEYLNPEGVINGTTGVMNSLYLAEAYANFGFIGIILMPILAGFVIMLIYKTILNKTINKTPVTTALFAYFAFNIPIQGGMIGFIWNVGWIVLFLFIFFSKRFIYFAKYNNWIK